jgi:triacylglycerol lipase
MWIRHIGNPGLRELTPDARAKMPIPDREDVDYSSYASCRPLHELPFWFRPYGSVIQEDNDGMVPVHSAQWGNFRGVVHADHVELLGWSLDLPNTRSGRPYDHRHFWARAATEAMAAAENDIT